MPCAPRWLVWAVGSQISMTLHIRTNSKRWHSESGMSTRHRSQGVELIAVGHPAVRKRAQWRPGNMVPWLPLCSLRSGSLIGKRARSVLRPLQPVAFEQGRVGQQRRSRPIGDDAALVHDDRARKELVDEVQ